MELESVHTIVDDSLLRHTPSSRHDGNDGGGAVDVENAVLLQELMALKVGAADVRLVECRPFWRAFGGGMYCRRRYDAGCIVVGRHVEIRFGAF